MMDIKIYTDTLELEGIVDQVDTFLWTPRYWNVGDFNIYAPATDANIEMLRVGMIAVKHAADNEIEISGSVWRRAGIIDYITLTKSSDGAEYIEATGSMLAGLLSRRVCYRQLDMTATSQAIITALVNTNCGPGAAAARRFEDFSMLPQSSFGTASFAYGNELFADLGMEVQQVACQGKLGYDILADISGRKLGFYLYKGNDFSSDTGGADVLVFSREFGNVEDLVFVESDSNMKTYAYITGSKDDNDRLIWTEAGAGSGRARREIAINAIDIDRKYIDSNGTEVTITLPAYKSMLANKGKAELAANSAEALNFSAAVKETNYSYGVDFAVGDVVTCRDRRWGIKIDVRITEVQESYTKEGKSLEVTFGEALPTLWQKVRKVR
jgi:hypothetical protein